MPTRLTSEAVDHRQPKTGALADGFGGKKRIEHAAHQMLRYAATVVADTQLYVVARGQGAVGGGKDTVEVAIGGLHGQRATRGHGVARVDHQVEQGAFELVRVGFGGPQGIAQTHVQADAFVDAALQQLAHGCHQLIDLHGLGVKRLSARKRQQPVCEAGRAIGGGHTQVDQAVQVIQLASGYPPAQQFQAADNAREHIVEVMGDTAGQLADGFHFLRLAQSLFVMAQLSRAFFHLLFKRFQGALQPQFTLAQVNQPVPCFVLATPTAQRGAHQADQGNGVERPLQKRHVAQQATEPGGAVLLFAAMMGHQHDRQVGPRRLLVQLLEQWFKVYATQRLGGNDEQAGALRQFFAHLPQVAGDDPAVAGFVKHHQRQ